MTSRGVDSVPWFRSVVMLKFLNLSVYRVQLWDMQIELK